MPRLPLALALTLAAALSTAAPARAGDAPPPAKEEVRLELVHVEMTGVTAEETPAVHKAVAAVAGVKTVEWVVEGAEVKVVREVGKAGDDALVAAAKGAGAESAGRVPLTLSNFAFDKKLHCGGCVALVDKALLGIQGVKSSTVNAEMTQVAVVYDTRAVKPADVEAALAGIKRPAKLIP